MVAITLSQNELAAALADVLAAGSNVTISAPVAGVITISASGGGGSLPDPTGENGKIVGVVSDAYALVAAPSGGSGGKVLGHGKYQTGAVATGIVPMPRDNTKPQNNEGDEYMTLTYNRQSASSKLRIDVVALSSHSAWVSSTVALFKDTTVDAIAAMPCDYPGTNYIFPCHFTHWMDSGATGDIAFKVRIGATGAGTTTFNGVGGAGVLGGAVASSITVTEYAV